MQKRKIDKIAGIISRFKSIRTSILCGFSLVVVLALVIFLVFSLRYTEEAVLENSREYTRQLVEQVNADIESYIAYMENISQMVTGNSDIIEYLYEEENPLVYYRYTELFGTVMSTRPDISNIAVLADNGRGIINRGDSTLNPYGNITERQWYRDTIEAGGKTVVSASHVQNAIQGDYPWVVTLSKGLINPKTGQVEGIFFIDMNYSSINDLCKNVSLGDKGYLFIIDKGGSIIYHPKQLLLYKGLITEWIDKVLAVGNGSFVTEEKNDSKLYSVCQSEKTGWTVVGVSYIREFIGNKKEMQMVYLAIALTLLILSMGLALLLSQAITRPIKQLKESMKDVQKGDFAHAAIQISGENEITSLGRSFNIMTEKIQDLMEQNVREQKEKRKSELKALQSQINPHFLYNTLDSIIWMAEGGKNEEVVLMTSSLAKLLRQSISNEDEEVTIEREIGYTTSYLTIQKMRYRDQLEFEIDVDPHIMRMKIVKLVVQPLVENAIYHGIKYLDRKGMIWITGEVEEDKIILRIQDNGAGMSKEKLLHILESEKPGEKANERSNHVGVYNVHNRLQLYYGKEYGLAYKSIEGIGTTVEIQIPNPEWEGEADEK